MKGSDIARDSGIGLLPGDDVKEPTPIVFPTPEIDVEKPSAQTSPQSDELNLKSSSKPRKNSFISQGIRERAKSLSSTPPSTLVKLLFHEESATKKTRKLLTAAVSQLDSASKRARDAESTRRESESQALLDKVKLYADAAAAKDEAQHAQYELELYRARLMQAEDEVRKTREAMRVLNEKRGEAERSAAHARAVARKYRGQNLALVAREKGKAEGYEEGLKLGREVAATRMRRLAASIHSENYVDAREITDNGGAFIEEVIEEGTDHNSPQSYTSTANVQQESHRRPEHRRSSMGRSRHRSVPATTAKREALSQPSSNHHEPEPRTTPEPEPLPDESAVHTPVPLPSTPPNIRASVSSPGYISPAPLPVPPPNSQDQPPAFGVSDEHNNSRSSSSRSSSLSQFNLLESQPAIPQTTSSDFLPHSSPQRTFSPQPPISTPTSVPEHTALPVEREIEAREPTYQQPQPQQPPHATGISPSIPESRPFVEPTSTRPPDARNLASMPSSNPPVQPSSQPSFNTEYIPMPPPPPTFSPMQTSSQPPPPQQQQPQQPQEYIPMPPPPTNVITRGIPAPVPRTTMFRPGMEEREREREVEVSTPSTMTGMSGIMGNLRSFPLVPPSTVGSVTEGGVGYAGSGGAPAYAGSGGAPGYTGSGGAAGYTGSEGGAGYAGSVPSNASSGRGGGAENRFRDHDVLSTIYEHSREGTPHPLTPTHTGRSSESSSRVDEWRRSLNADQTPTPTQVPPFPNANGNNVYSPGQPSLHPNTNHYLGTSPHRRSSSASTSNRTASIHIEVEPPSRSPSSGHRTPTPQGPSSGHYESFQSNVASSSGWQRPVSPAGIRNVYKPPEQPAFTPGYLSPHRSPLDLAPVGSGPGAVSSSGVAPAPNVEEPPVIPGVNAQRGTNPPFQRPRSRSDVNSTSGPQLAMIYQNNELPPGFIPKHIQYSQSAHKVPFRKREEYNENKDEEEDDDLSEGSTGKPWYGVGPPMKQPIPPGVVTGGTPQPAWNLPSTSRGTGSTPRGQGILKYPPPPSNNVGPVGSLAGSSTSTPPWPTNVSPAGSTSPLPNPLPRPPTFVSPYGAKLPSNSPWTGFGPPPQYSSPNAGAPRVGFGDVNVTINENMPPTMDQSLTNSPNSRSNRRASLNAGTTPLRNSQPLPSAMKHGRRSSISSSASNGIGRSPLGYAVKSFPAADSFGGQSSSTEDDDDAVDAATQENTLANSRMGGSPYLSPAPMPMSLASPATRTWG